MSQRANREDPDRTGEKPRLPAAGALERSAGVKSRVETGQIDEARWYDAVSAVIVPAYLAGSNPRAHSVWDGKSLRA